MEPIRLNWEKLLSPRRERQRDPSGSIPPSGESLVIRTEFEADYDRIVGSSSVRRLQDKAQVYPLQQNDVARTRLTHSIEVSGLARSLGKATGCQLEKKGEFTRDQTDQLADLLQVAGLIHDLGNPPFGHYGETVIRNWFKKWFASNQILATHNIVLSEQEKNDFLYFDGNVQNLRIVTRLQILNDLYGANFTFATLGTIMKYPWRSNPRPDGQEKFGYFKSEEALAEMVRAELGLADGVRHPATYLLEAADDIIYLCDDIEDGVKKGLFNWSREYEAIKKNLQRSNSLSEPLKELFAKIEKKEPDPRMDEQEKETARVRIFRNLVQSFLFTRVIEEFLRIYDEKIMGNIPQYGLELLHCEKPLIKELKRVTREHCFPCQEALWLELEGDRVISTLMDVFVPALIEHTGEELADIRQYSGKLFRLISPNFLFVALAQHIDGNRSLADQIDLLRPYERLQLVTDFISGMTDSYAVDVYQKLMGMKHP